MDFYTISSIVLIGIGAIFMFASTLFSLSIYRLLPAVFSRPWRILTFFIEFFLAGYIFYIVILTTKVDLPLQLIVGFIFLMGAIFVFSFIKLTKKTMSKLHSSEEALRKSNEELESRVEQRTNELLHSTKQLDLTLSEMTQILDTTASGIRVVDTNYIIKRANKTFLRMVNLPKEKVIGRNCYDIFSGPICKTPNCPLERITKAQDPISYQADKTNINGTVTPCMVTAAPFLGKNGKLFGIVEDFRDLTELLETEKEKDVLQTRLVQAQKLEAVGQLAAGIAHEINTPTQYIESNIDFLGDAFDDISDLMAHYNILLESAKKGSLTTEQTDAADNSLEEADWNYLREEVPNAVTQAKEGTHRVSTIVRAMKEFSHPSSKDKVPSDLTKIITNTTTVCQNEWKNVADLETDFAPDLPLVPVVADEIGQVILNIMVNASHAISDKLEDVHEDGKGTIKITAKTHSENAEITITDSGSGMPEKVLKQVFDPFYTTKEVGRGSGQGLAIAHDVITNKHGGSIKVESEIGKGTTFIIHLPLAAEQNKG